MPNSYLSIHSGATIDSAVTRAMTFPTPNSANDGKILVGANSGFEAIEFSDAFASNINQINLTGYTAPVSTLGGYDTTPISGSDTIPGAFSKAQAQILNIIAHDITEVNNTVDNIAYNIEKTYSENFVPRKSFISGWTQGSINTSTGGEINASLNIRSGSFRVTGKLFIKINSDDYNMRVYRYSGSPSTSTYINCSSNIDAKHGIIVGSNADGALYYRLSVWRKDHTTVGDATITDVTSKLIGNFYIDTDLVRNGVAADAYTTGVKIKTRISSLDEYAWKDFTYRRIFFQGDLLRTRGHFEQGMDFLDHNDVNGEGGLVTTFYNSPTHSLQVIATNAPNRWMTGEYTIAAGHTRFLGCKIYAPIITAGSFGVTATSNVLSAKISTSNTGFETVTAFYKNTSSSRFKYWFGAYGDNAQGTAYIDDVVIVDMTTVFGEDSNFPTNQQMIEFYEAYVDYCQRVQIEQRFEINSAEITAFTDAMTTKCADLGITDATWVTPAGNGTDNRANPTALVKIMRAALGYNQLVERMGNNTSKDIIVKGLNGYRTINLSHTAGMDSTFDDYDVLSYKSGTWLASSASYGGYFNNVYLARHKATGIKMLVAIMKGHSQDTKTAVKEALDATLYNYQNPSSPITTLTLCDECVGIVMDDNGGQCYNNVELHPVLSVNPTTNSVPASTTKILCAITALDYVQDMNEIITIQANDIDENGSGNVFLWGDRVRFGDLLFAGMYISSNSAMTAIGRHVGRKILDYRGIDNV